MMPALEIEIWIHSKRIFPELRGQSNTSKLVAEFPLSPANSRRWAPCAQILSRDDLIVPRSLSTATIATSPRRPDRATMYKRRFNIWNIRHFLTDSRGFQTNFRFRLEM